MADYRIQLGVKLDTSDLHTQISKYAGNNAPKIKLNIDSKGVDKQLSSIRKQIQNLSNVKINLGGNTKSGAVNALNISTADTAKVVQSFNEVKNAILSIRSAIGTLDDGGEMKSLLTSINQISAALDKASGQFTELNTQLKSLSSKDFNINFGITMGGKSFNNIAYGREARKVVIPQLEAQIKYLENAFGGAQNALKGLSLNMGTIKFDPYEGFANFSSDNMIKRMEAYEHYINSLKKLASIKNIDLSGFNSRFSKSASQMIDEVTGVTQATDVVEKDVQKLKSLFGSGVNAEALNTQLDSIVLNLNEIKIAIQGLSSGITLNGLTESFDRLSMTLKELMSNVTVVQNTLGTGMSGAGSSVASVGEQFRLADIKIGDFATKAQNVRQVLGNIGFSNSSIDVITKDLNEAGIAMQNVTNLTTALNSKGALTLTVKGIDQYERVITATRTLGQDGSLSAWSTKASQSFKTQAQALKELLAVSKQIGSIGKGIQGLKNLGGDSAQITELENRLKSLQTIYNQIESDMSTPPSGNQWSGVLAQIESVQNELRELGAVLTNTETRFNIQSNFGAYDAQIASVETRFSALANKSTELRTAIDGVKLALEQMKVAAANGDTAALEDANARYLKSLKDVEAQLKKNRAEEQRTNNTNGLAQAKEKMYLKMSNWLKDNSAAAKQFGGEIKALQDKLNSCGNTKAVRKVGEDFDIVAQKAKLAGLTTKTFGDSLKDQFRQYSSYFSVYTLFMYTTRAMRSMFEQVKLIDSAMTELKKVTDETDASYNQFLSNAASRAREIGTTIDGLVSSTADFARLGYSFADSQELAEVANIYAVVGDEVEGVEGATQSLISTMTAFKGEMGSLSYADFATGISDIFNELGNNFAITSGGLGEAFQRSASSMSVAGNTLAETAALITSANTVVELCHAA